MKRIVTMLGLMMGLLWGQQAVAQPINYGVNKAATLNTARTKDKEEYAEEAEARLVRLRKSFGERTREKDPFGSNMDPGIFKAVDTPFEDLLETKAAEPVKIVPPLQDVVDKFKWNLISVPRGLVMIGSRTLRVGDLVQIECRGVLFKLRITKITKHAVEFINTETGEKATAREPVFDPNSLGENAGDLLDKISREEPDLIIK